MTQTYTRQSSFSDGDTITAALFNDEYNQLVNAFAYSTTSSSTGHQHDGSTAEGGNIHTIGDLDFLNKIVADSTNNRWGVFVEVSSAAVEQIRIQDGAIVPVTDNDIDLGTSSAEFKDAYFDGTVTTDGLTVSSTTNLDGAIQVDNTITVGVDDTGYDVKFFGDTASAYMLWDTSTDDLVLAGAAGLDIAGDIDVDGTANLDVVDIDGAVDMASTLAVAGALTGSSTIQGTTITATTAFVPDASDGAALGTSSLEFSDLFLADGAVINFGDDQDVSLTHVADTGLLLSSTDQLQFGDSGTYIYQSADGVLDLVSDTEIEINATTIDINGAADISGNLAVGGNLTVTGTATIAGNLTFGDAASDTVAFSADVASNLLPSADNTYDLGASGSEWKDLYLDGTANIDSLVADTADINGGTVDGATIGASSASSGAFTTITASSSITGSSTVQGTTITATTAFVPDASDGAALGTSALEFSDLFLADGAVINFGDDQDVSLTHVADTGILLSSTDQLQFGDSGTYIYQSADGVLDLVSDTEIEINATTIDMNGNVDISGTLTVAGALDFGDAALSNVGAVQLDSIAGDGDTNTSITFSGSDVITIATGGSGRLTIGDGALSPVTDNEMDLGTSSLEFKDAYFDGTVTSDAFAGPLTGDVTGTLQTAAQGNITSLGTLTALTVDDVAIDGKVITMTGSTSDTAVFTAGTNGTLSIVTTDAAAAAANIQITADGTVDIDSAGVLTLDSGAAINIEPAAGSAILLDGTISVDAGVVTGATSITSTAFVGDITGDVTGNTSGTAATVTTAAQSNITSLGTLTTLTVDNVIINGTTIGHTSDTDLMTLTSGVLTVAGEVDATSLDISGDADIDGTANLDVVDIDGAVDMASTLQVDGVLTTSASVGIGVTPKAWYSGFSALQLSDTGVVVAENVGGESSISIGENFYIDTGGSTDYLTTDEASVYQQNNGTHEFRVAVSGSADAAITWITAMTIANSGNVTINEAGADLDFRVESNGNANMIFVDGGEDRVGIGCTPGYDFELRTNDTSAEPAMVIRNLGTGDASIGFQTAGGNNWTIGTDNSVNDNFMIAEGLDGADSKLVVTTGGNVGIGLTTPNEAGYGSDTKVLSVQGASADNFGVLELLSPDTTSANRLGEVLFGNLDGGGTVVASSRIRGTRDGADNSTALSFWTTNAGTIAEKMSILSTGRTLIALSSALSSDNGGGLDVFATGGGPHVMNLKNSDTSGGANMIRFIDGSGDICGEINSNATSDTTSYGTSSDGRYKDVIGKARGLEIINSLNPVKFTWKSSGEEDEGLIAQEVLEIVPNAITGSEETKYMMDYSKLVTPLVKAIQEQQEQIEQLKAEVQTLKGE